MREAKAFLSIRVKILFILLTPTLLLGLGMVIFAETVIQGKLRHTLSEKGEGVAKRVAADCISSVMQKRYFEVEIMLKDIMASEKDIVYAYVLNKEGRELASTFAEGVPQELKLAHQSDPRQLNSTTFLSTDMGTIFDIAVPLQKGQAGVLHLGLSDATVRDDINNIVILIILFSVVMLLTLTAVSIRLSRLISRPLAKLAQAAEAFGRGEMGQQTSINSKDELGGLETVFNEMVEKRQRSEDALRENLIFQNSLLNAISIPVFYKDRDGRYLEFNSAFETFFGATREQLIGKSVFDINPPELAEIYHARDTELFENGGVQQYESQVRDTHGVLHDVIFNKTLFTDNQGSIRGLIGTVLDITKRKLAEKALQRMNRELRAISNCNQTMMRAEDEQTLLNDICHIVCDEAGYYMAWVGYAENDDARTIRPVAWAGEENGYLANAAITWADVELGRGPSGTAIRSGESACIQDFTTDPTAAPWRDSAVQRGYRSSIALPLKNESGKAFGVLNIYAAEPNAFTPDEIRLLNELAEDLAYGVTVLRARIEQKRAKEDLAERAVLAELAADIGYALAKQGDLRSVLTACTEALVRHLDVAFARIWVLNTTENVLEMQASAGIYTRIDGSHDRIPVGKLKIGLIAEERKPHITNAVIGDPRVNDQEWAKREGMVAFAGHPLAIEDKLVGVMAMFSRHPLTEITIKALAAVSNEIAVGIERKRMEKESLAHLRFVESMDQINRAIHGTNNMEKMMRDLLETVLAIFDCDRAWLFYPCDPEVPFFQVPMEITRPEYPGAGILNVDIPLPPDMAQNLKEALEAAGPVTYTAGTEKEINQVSAEQFKVKSMMMVALYPKSGKPWTFGLHQCSYPRVWTPEDKRLFQEIGRRLADGLTSLLSHRELEESETKYRRIVETSKEGIWVLGPDTMTTFVNARMAELLGCSKEEMLGRPVTAFMFEEDILNHHQRMENRRKGLSEHYERRFRHINGQAVWTLASATAIFDETHHFQGSFAMFTDITDRKQAENSLLESEAFVRKILETVDEGFIVIDRNYKIMSANKAFCSAVKLSEEQVLDRYCYEISHHINKPCFEYGEDCAVKQTFETGASHAVSHTHVNEGGEKRHVEIKSYPVTDASGEVVSAIETLTDVTEKWKLEEQLRHAQRLEALGTLAGGVAHDFNNILTVIVGFGEMIKMRMAADDPNLRYIRDILSSSARAAQLTRSLLIFSRRQPAELKPFDLNDLVSGMEKMMLRLIGEDIEIKIVLSPEILVVLGDYGQLEQVLMNFVTNARAAMPDGGTLTIKTEICGVDSEFAHMHGFDRPGKYALISVSDTGKGMDARTRERIFEPFFTTKEAGKGTGLGLAIVYGIVKQHNGYINCYSEPDKGTVFKVYLPLIREEFIGTENAEEIVPITVQGGAETILIADDEEIIRKFVKELLEKYGYTVIEAIDGKDAVSKFMSNREKIRLVLLDVIMPRLSGKEAFEEIRAVQPEIKVLFFSGYTEDIIKRKRILEDKLPLLHKPVKPQELLKKIRECLDAT